jgi:formate/nitrite transporter FocA (FNT family)
MYFIPVGLLVKARGGAELLSAFASADLDGLNMANFLGANLLPVTIGNIIGGAVFVGLAYWFIYLRRDA